MYYFFGAGENCISAIRFFGKDNIIAIVDNSVSRIGTAVLGVQVIGFDEFMQKRTGETVIITAFIASKEIAAQLEKAGITDYFICPYMQSGFYNCDQIIETWNLLQYDSIAFYEKSPISSMLMESILKKKEGTCSLHEITEKEWQQEDDCTDVDLLVVIKENINSTDLHLLSKYGNVLNLYKEIKDRRKIDYGYLEKYYNNHEGGRCFLIGNGPSLKTEDLDKIFENKEMSFGCNQIYKIFKNTSWRPDYYVIGDGGVYDEIEDKLPKERTVFIRNFMKKMDKKENVVCYSSTGEKYYPGYPGFSDDLVQGVFGGRTVMYDMMQIAVYMGFKQIYLLGVDLSWGEDGKDTHFCKDYMDEEKEKQIRENIKYKGEIEHAYISARRYGEKHSIKIYNATRGGHLEIFERVDIEKLLYI